jgi:hypothetical protein
MNLEKYIAPFVLDMRNKEDNREVEIKQKS